jgi:hypothetical protein
LPSKSAILRPKNGNRSRSGRPNPAAPGCPIQIAAFGDQGGSRAKRDPVEERASARVTPSRNVILSGAPPKIFPATMPPPGAEECHPERKPSQARRVERANGPPKHADYHRAENLRRRGIGRKAADPIQPVPVFHSGPHSRSRSSSTTP